MSPRINVIHRSMNESTRHILIGVTGSIAAIQLPQLIQGLLQTLDKIELQIIYTKTAQHFFSVQELKQQGFQLWTDGDEWKQWNHRDDPILHIELRRWAHLFIIAPLTANTLAKIANGLCDNLLTSVLRAWTPYQSILLAPAMNTWMWSHPLTQQHVTLVSQTYRSVQWIGPVEKKLA
ncbi:hypothetical protein PCK2_000940, partial [Pneumocystis canis]